MTYVSSVGDKAHTVDTGEDGPQSTRRSDGRINSIDWRQIAPWAENTKGLYRVGGRFSLLIEGKSYEVFARRVNKPEEKGYRYEILVAGQRFEVSVEDEREKALTGSIQTAHESGEAMVRAPMPGLVLGLPMEPGAKVERGQTVVVLEAMKMENDLASPIGGKVEEITVSKGPEGKQEDILVVVTRE